MSVTMILVINRILSLHLSNDDDIPQQIELCLSRDDYQLQQFCLFDLNKLWIK
jgi:hypothetical protein